MPLPLPATPPPSITAKNFTNHLRGQHYRANAGGPTVHMVGRGEGKHADTSPSPLDRERPPKTHTHTSAGEKH